MMYQNVLTNRLKNHNMQPCIGKSESCCEIPKMPTYITVYVYSFTELYKS